MEILADVQKFKFAAVRGKDGNNMWIDSGVWSIRQVIVVCDSDVAEWCAIVMRQSVDRFRGLELQASHCGVR